MMTGGGGSLPCVLIHVYRPFGDRDETAYFFRWYTSRGLINVIPKTHTASVAAFNYQGIFHPNDLFSVYNKKNKNILLFFTVDLLCILNLPKQIPH